MSDRPEEESERCIEQARRRVVTNSVLKRPHLRPLRYYCNTIVHVEALVIGRRVVLITNFVFFETRCGAF